MIDWHSHILPRIDDGSCDIDESIALLSMLKHQGVGIVAATPHFFADDMSVEKFLSRRQQSLDAVRAALQDSEIDIVTGAEVRYYPGIGKLDGLEKLCIGGSNLLLLEMPMGEWTDYTVRELSEIANTSGVRLILAHIERYLTMQRERSWSKLYDSGILMQVNASFFNEFGTRRKALSMLKKGNIHIVGSDCHNLKYRPPKLDKAYAIIKKKLGDDFVTQFNEYGCSLLNTNKTV